MTNFKIGDRVRVSKILVYSKKFNDRLGIISRIDSDERAIYKYLVKLDINSDTIWVSESELELELSTPLSTNLSLLKIHYPS